jgi:N-acetylglucosamine kinase-like BadF-type ATPase
MILIADSGSTKTSWCVADSENTKDFYSTNGINPFFRTTEDIVAELKNDLVPKINGKITAVYFYGAGVVNDEKAGVIKNALSRLFPGAALEVESDLLAAARATLGKKSGIACILGTGSNSCLYDGDKITAHVPPLGFILGDEGSGAYLGRKLVGDYLKGIMPDELSAKFNEKFPFQYADFLNSVYKEEKPNRFLAGFVPFLKENIENDYCDQLVRNAFGEFIDRNVSQYEGYKQNPVCFVGSVAFHFQEQLLKVLVEKNCTPGTVIKEPLLNLLHYHLQFSKNDEYN